MKTAANAAIVLLLSNLEMSLVHWIETSTDVAQEVGRTPRHGTVRRAYSHSRQPVWTARVQSHSSRKAFLEQAGQISERQALGSTRLAPRPEGNVMEDPSHLPSVPRILPTVVTLGSRSSGEHTPASGLWAPHGRRHAHRARSWVLVPVTQNQASHLLGNHNFLWGFSKVGCGSGPRSLLAPEPEPEPVGARAGREGGRRWFPSAA